MNELSLNFKILRIVPEDTVRSYYFYDRAEDVDATS